jgi:hypothetical protein
MTYVVESDLLIVLAFRGTRSTINWETNLHAWLIHPADRVYDVIGEVLSINDVNLSEMLREAPYSGELRIRSCSPRR